MTSGWTSPRQTMLKRLRTEPSITGDITESRNPMTVQCQDPSSWAACPLSSILSRTGTWCENVVSCSKGALSGRDINELIEQCHPQVCSKFTMRSIPTLKPVPRDTQILPDILVDTLLWSLLSCIFFCRRVQEHKLHQCPWGSWGWNYQVVSDQNLLVGGLSNFVSKLGGDNTHDLGDLLRGAASTSDQHYSQLFRYTPLNRPAMRIGSPSVFTRRWPAFTHWNGYARRCCWRAGTSAVLELFTLPSGTSSQQFRRA
jgi:hypothetical protein